MTSIRIQSFSGVAPKMPARYLRNEQAQQALNCPAWVGPLQPLRGSAAVAATLQKSASGTVESIYRFGQDVESDTQYWYHWLGDVDVAKGFVAGDTSERTCYTGDGLPKATNNELGLLGGSNYPVASYMLGVPRPTTAPSASAVGDPDPNAVAESRVYTYTWVNSWGEESAPFMSDPMPASALVDVEPQQTVSINLPVPPTGPHNITHKRIYRSVIASDGSVEFLFVAEIPAAQQPYTDALDADEIGEALPSLTWDAPPEDLAGLVALSNGIMAGFDGYDVYQCEPNRPFAWPEDYVQTAPSPVVGLGSIDTTIVVCTKGKPQFIQGSHPDASAMVEVDIDPARVSKRSIVSMLGMVIYASPDGLVAAVPGNSRLLTEELFFQEQWQTIKPESIHAYAHEGRYVAFYETGAVQGGFIFDPRTGSLIWHDIYATAGYNDLARDALFVVIDGDLQKWDHGAALSYVWRSKKFTFPQAIGFAAAKVEAESYPVTAKFYADSNLIHTKAVQNRQAFRVPGTKGTDWEVELSGSVEVFNVVLAQSMAEIARNE